MFFTINDLNEYMFSNDATISSVLLKCDFMTKHHHGHELARLLICIQIHTGALLTPFSDLTPSALLSAYILGQINSI